MLEREPGTLFYEVGQSRDDPETYRVVEIFRDQEAVDLHNRSEWLAQAMDGIRSLLSELDVQYHDTAA